MEDRVKYWSDLSDYDFDTAKAMFTTGRWLYVGFMCHQTIEKIFKAYWCTKSTQTTRCPIISSILLRAAA